MLCIAKEAPDASHLPNEPIPTAPLVGADDPARPPPSIFCRTSGRVCRGRCRAQLFATKERYRCGLPLAGTHRPASAILHRTIVFECRGRTTLSARQRPPLRQTKPAAFRFRRGGENSISAASFFLSKPEPFHWVPVWLTNGGCRQRRLGEFLKPFFSFSFRKKRTVSIFQEKKEGRAKPELQTVPPSRQKKPAPFRFRRGGENSISAAFFLPKL